MNPEKLFSYLTQLPANIRRLWVGYSGGMDSHVLLHGLNKALIFAKDNLARELDYQILHVHHGLHPEADAWVQHTQVVCKSLNLPLTVAYAKPAQFPDMSPEAAARAARQQAWAQHLDPEQDALVLAHHMDDQAETLLHRLCRGTGVSGLAAMQSLGLDPKGYWVWRPFLAMGLDRKAIQAYALAQGLSWVEDSSNQDTRFDRNFLRQTILPLLKTRWPKVSEAIGRTAQLCNIASKPTQTLAAEDIQRVAYVSEEVREPGKGKVDQARLDKESAHLMQAMPGTALSVCGLLSLPLERRREVLRHWCQQGGYPPSFAQAVRIEREILQAYAGGKPRLKIDHREVRRWRDMVYLVDLRL